MSDVLHLSPAGLLSKWGFDDGELPDSVMDYCEDKHIPYPPDWHAVLRRLVRERLIPALDQRVTVVDIETNHNPVRAETVDGVDARDQWYDDTDLRLTPEWVEIPLSEVVKMWHPADTTGETANG